MALFQQYLLSEEHSTSMIEIARPVAIIFDLDGTLVDTFAHMADSFAIALADELGRQLTLEEFYSQIGPGAGTEPQILNHFAGREAPELFEKYCAYHDSHPEKMPLFPGVAPMLHMCRAAGVKLGIMTGKSRITTLTTLAHGGILDVFDAIISGDEAVRPKPDPMGLELALSALKVKSDHTIYVGDSLADVLAGKAASMATILAGWNRPADAAKTAEQTCPDAFFYSVDDLSIWLSDLLQSH
jgi:pyrophosphatase PpaX